MATDRPYAPQLDGLRAIAVAAVAWSHWQDRRLLGFALGDGVYLFYVLSGFLITGILYNLRGVDDRGAGLRAFYARRALRIFPAFYLTIAIVALADVPGVRESWLWHATYLSNVWIGLHGWPDYLSHFWSLAVEEQFYLLWPWLILFAPARALVPAIATTIVAAPVFHLWIDSLDPANEAMIALLPSSLDALGAGALLAVLDRRQASGLSPRAMRTALWCSLPPFLALQITGALGYPLPFWGPALLQTFEAFVFGWVVLSASRGFSGPVARVLSAPPMRYVGRISYGAYLWHAFMPLLVDPVVDRLPVGEWWVPIRGVMLAVATIAVAAASWHLVEEPINRLKSRFPYVPFTARL